MSLATDHPVLPRSPSPSLPPPTLPPLHTCPSAQVLTKLLAALTLTPASWQPSPDASASTPPLIVARPVEVPKWLTSVIASPLSWIPDQATVEVIRAAAAKRLAERCGRTAMPALTRQIHLPIISLGRRQGGEVGGDDDEDGDGKAITITLHEPSLTADNLGLKTWASSFYLAKRLPLLNLPAGRALELGAGTGLVGMSAAARGREVVVTDLPQIVDNLRRNVLANADVLRAEVDVRVLDWRDVDRKDGKGKGEGEDGGETFRVVMVADPIYDGEHPRLLAGAICRKLERSAAARAVVEMPLRKRYEQERENWRHRMAGSGLRLVEEGTETGWDVDWGVEGEEVVCWWSVWGWG